MGEREGALTPAEAQLRAQSELKGSETLTWSGTPEARRAAIGAISETITPGIALVGFALLWTIPAYNAVTSARAASSHGGLLAAGVIGRKKLVRR